MGVSHDVDQARGRLQAAVDLAGRTGFGLSRDDVAQISTSVADADAALARAQDSLRHDPFVAVLGALPISGQQVSAVDTMVEALRKVTSRHDLAGRLLSNLVEARDSGGAGGSRIAALARYVAANQRDLDEMLASILAAADSVDGVQSDGLLGPAASARALLATKFDAARPAVSAAQEVTAVLPSIMGIGGPKRYLVFALDNAEIRPIGGLIAAFATPRFEDGTLEDLTFRDIQSIDRPDQKTYVEPPQPFQDHLLGAFTWQVADAGWSPDYAASMADALRMYRLETGDTNIQGTIAFTPDFVDRLLSVVGPVPVPEAGVTVHPGETYLLSLEQVEVLHRGEGRKAFLAQLASEVLNRLFALPASRYADVLEAIGDAGARRELQMGFDDPASQAAIEAMGLSGSFTFPAKSDRLAIMEANVAPVSKLDVLLTMEHSLDVEIQRDGSAMESLTTTYTNGFGPNLPPELNRVRSAFFAGILGSYNRRYLDPRADVSAVTGDDSEAPISGPGYVETELGSLSVGNYQFVRPGTVHMTTEYTVPDIVDRAAPNSGKGHVYRLAFRKQPGRDDDTLAVRITVPDGMTPIRWSDGGSVDGNSVSFSTTTEFDHLFEVEFGTP